VAAAVAIFVKVRRGNFIQWLAAVASAFLGRALMGPVEQEGKPAAAVAAALEARLVL
jgi:hypothetical protein